MGFISHVCRFNRLLTEQSFADFIFIFSRLPTTAIEVFQDENWKCLPRTSDNFFLMSLPDHISDEDFDFPLEARASTVSGQTLGFTINTRDVSRDTVIPVQYNGFDDTGIERTQYYDFNIFRKILLIFVFFHMR